MRPGPDEVHLWTWRLDPSGPDLAASEPLLDADERARAERFQFARDRTRFVAGRAGLRTTLARYLATPAQAVAFRYGPFGKPSLADATGFDLRFNLAHSGEIALLAIATGFEVGVDVERVRDLDVDRLAAQTLSAAEAAALRSVRSDRKRLAFFQAWTRKEAYVKALGRGFDLPLSSFDVSLEPGEPARLLRVDDDPEEPERWRIEHLEPEPGYVGALAARRLGWRAVGMG